METILFEVKNLVINRSGATMVINHNIHASVDEFAEVELLVVRHLVNRSLLLSVRNLDLVLMVVVKSSLATGIGITLSDVFLLKLSVISDADITGCDSNFVNVNVL